MYGRALCCPPQTVTALLFSSTPIENKSFLKNWLTLGTSKKPPTVYHNCQINRMAKSFIWVFCNIIWKSLKELFGQPSISLKAVTWVTLLQNETILWESHYCGFDFEKTTLFYFLIPEFLQLAIFFPKENDISIPDVLLKYITSSNSHNHWKSCSYITFKNGEKKSDFPNCYKCLT